MVQASIPEKGPTMPYLRSFLVSCAGTLALAMPAAHAATPEDAILTKAGCTACHAINKKVIGPAYKDVAAKYKGKDAAALLFDKVRKGGSGVYGTIPMAPNPVGKISDADLKKVIAYILKL